MGEYASMVPLPNLDAALLMLLADGHGAPGRLDHGWPPLRLRENIDTGGEAKRAETPRGVYIVFNSWSQN